MSTLSGRLVHIGLSLSESSSSHRPFDRTEASSSPMKGTVSRGGLPTMRVMRPFRFGVQCSVTPSMAAWRDLAWHHREYGPAVLALVSPRREHERLRRGTHRRWTEKLAITRAVTVQPERAAHGPRRRATDHAHRWPHLVDRGHARKPVVDRNLAANHSRDVPGSLHLRRGTTRAVFVTPPSSPLCRQTRCLCPRSVAAGLTSSGCASPRTGMMAALANAIAKAARDRGARGQPRCAVTNVNQNRVVGIWSPQSPLW